jgi:lysophospholipase L1-like esterase
MFDISKIDKNFKAVERSGSVMQEITLPSDRLDLYGVYYEPSEGRFRRLPNYVAEKVNDGVKNLATNTAGGRIRFITNSPYIAIKVVLPHATFFSHMALAGVAGFDLYVKENGRYTSKKTFLPPYNFEDSYEGVYDFTGEACERDITLNFPLYNQVYQLYIGIKEGSVLKAAPEYKYDKPIVYYGSSITQGGCASRPGNAYQGIITRKFDVDHVNLGFSGNGKAEKPIVDYIAGLDMQVFVMDYDHNAPNPEYLRETHSRFFNIIREKNPELPILILTCPRYTMTDIWRTRQEIIKETYDAAVARGDKNVYILYGSEFFSEIGNEYSVDDTHPTDEGFYYMAKAIAPTLKKMLEK